MAGAESSLYFPCHRAPASGQSAEFLIFPDNGALPPLSHWHGETARPVPGPSQVLIGDFGFDVQDSPNFKIGTHLAAIPNVGG